MLFSVLTLVFVCATLGSGSPTTTSRQQISDIRKLDSISAKILELVEKLREQMKEGAPDLGIPPLDPLTIDKVDLSGTQIGDNVVKLDVAILEKITVLDLPKFVVDHVKANILNMNLDLNLTFPQIILTGQYVLDGTIYNLIPIYGQGPFYVGLFDLKIGGKALLGSKDGKIFLEKLRLYPSLGRLNVLVDGILGGGDLGVQLNGILQTVGGDIVNKFLPSLSDAISEFARDKINGALKDIDFSSIIG